MQQNSSTKTARMAALTEKEPEIVDESDGDDDVPEDAYDVLESALCGEYGADGHSVNMSQSVKNDVKNAQRAAHKAANIGLCQDTRATTEQVLDPRTRLILFKLLQRNAFAKLEGCLSTGKEANVYYALSGDGLRDIEATRDVPSNSPLAVKVYKTSILVFRDRRRYVDGEHRFEKGYTSGKNPRKMVQLWAEKELRNYKRCRRGVGNAVLRHRRASSPSDEAVGGFISDFEPFRTPSSRAGSTRMECERRGRCC